MYFRSCIGLFLAICSFGIAIAQGSAVNGSKLSATQNNAEKKMVTQPADGTSEKVLRYSTRETSALKSGDGTIDHPTGGNGGSGGGSGGDRSNSGAEMLKHSGGKQPTTGVGGTGPGSGGGKK
jgi:hypothetical protein